MTIPSSNSLGYTGLKETNPPNIRYFRRAPTVNDITGFDIGDFWIDTLLRQSWQLMNKAAGVADWRVMAAIAGAVNLTPNGGGAVAPVANNINLLGDGNGIQTANGGAGTLNVVNTFAFTPDVGGASNFVAGNLTIIGGANIQTSNAGAGTIQIDTTMSLFSWSIVTSATNPNILAVDNGYIAKGVPAVNFILPAAASVGDVFWIKGYGNLWTLSQNALQVIRLGFPIETTVGALGKVTATTIKDSIQLLCVTKDIEFEIISCIGNPLLT